MEFLLIILANTIWAIYSLSEGLKDGAYDFYKDSSKKNTDFNYKKMLFIQRGLVLVSTSSLLIFSIGWISIIFILSKIVLFKYFYFITYECSLRKIQNQDDDSIKNILQEKKNNFFNKYD